MMIRTKEVIIMEGSPKQYPPMQPPPIYTTGPPGGLYIPRKGYINVIIFGIILLLIGGIIFVSSGFLDDPYEPDYDDYGEYQEDEEDYRDNIRLIQTIGSVVQYFGLILFSWGMLIGALTDRDLAQNIRLGMLISLGIIIGFKIGGSVVYYWF